MEYLGINDHVAPTCFSSKRQPICLSLNFQPYSDKINAPLFGLFIQIFMICFDIGCKNRIKLTKFNRKGNS